MKKQIPLFPVVLVLALASTTAFADRGDRKTMKNLDTDGDGQISLQEFQDRKKNRFEDIDIDKDGGISLEEMQAAAEERFQRHKAKMTEKTASRFAETDKNGDGIVTPEEAQLVAFSKLDDDGNGFISKEEAETAKHHHGKMKRRKHRRGQ